MLTVLTKSLAPALASGLSHQTFISSKFALSTQTWAVLHVTT